MEPSAPGPPKSVRSEWGWGWWMMKSYFLALAAWFGIDTLLILNTGMQRGVLRAILEHSPSSEILLLLALAWGCATVLDACAAFIEREPLRNIALTVTLSLSCVSFTLILIASFFGHSPDFGRAVLWGWAIFIQARTKILLARYPASVWEEVRRSLIDVEPQSEEEGRPPGDAS